METPLQGIPVLFNRISLTWQNLILLISHDICNLNKLGTNLQRKYIFFIFQQIRL